MVAERSVAVTHEAGLHVRPASCFVQAATRFRATIQLEARGQIANAKSIMAVLKLGVRLGDTVTLRATGEDAEEAVTALAKILEGDLM